MTTSPTRPALGAATGRQGLAVAPGPRGDEPSPSLPPQARIPRHRATPVLTRWRQVARRWLPGHPAGWLLLAVPMLIAAAVIIGRPGSAPGELWPMLLCWIFTRFAYSAGAGLLAESWRSRPPRGPGGAAAPTLLWTTLALGCGCWALAEAGWRLAAWAGVYLPLIALALWLAAHRSSAGLLSITAASLAPLTLLHPDPARFALGTGATALALVSFGYLGGVALHLRALVAHRDQLRRQLSSVGWHAVFAAVALVCTAAGDHGLPWAAFFGLTMLRALMVPVLLPLLEAPLRRTLGTGVVLTAEAGLATSFCVLAVHTLAVGGAG